MKIINKFKTMFNINKKSLINLMIITNRATFKYKKIMDILILTKKFNKLLQIQNKH